MERLKELGEDEKEMERESQSRISSALSEYSSIDADSRGVLEELSHRSREAVEGLGGVERSSFLTIRDLLSLRLRLNLLSYQEEEEGEERTNDREEAETTLVFLKEKGDRCVESAREEVGREVRGEVEQMEDDLEILLERKEELKEETKKYTKHSQVFLFFYHHLVIKFLW